MLTNSLIDKFYTDVDLLGLKFPVAAISQKTGLSKGLISDVLLKKKKPSEKLINAFYEKFSESLPKVHAEEIHVEPVEGLNGKIVIDTSFLLRFAEEHANKVLAEKDARIADLKEIIKSGLVDIKNQATDITISLGTVLELLNGLKAGQRTKSDVILAALEKVGGYEKGALAKELRNQEVVAGNLLKEKGNRPGAGKIRKSEE